METLQNELIQRRQDTVSSGSFNPIIPGLTGLVFVKMGLKEKGRSSRAYSSKLKELYAEGGYFSEALIPHTLEKICKEQGLDFKVLDKQREILRRFYEAIPDDLRDPVAPLTEEEQAEMSPEEQEAFQKKLEERGKRIHDFMDNFYTDEDRETMAQAKQIEMLEGHIRANTAEHLAQKFQMEIEILLCARKAENLDQPYFSTIDEILELEDTNRPGLIQLYQKWKQFKEGMLPEFFRPDSPIQ